MPHIGDDELELYCMGQLDYESRSGMIEEHLLSCRACQGRLEATDAFITALRMSTSPNFLNRPSSGIPSAAVLRHPLSGVCGVCRAPWADPAKRSNTRHRCKPGHGVGPTNGSYRATKTSIAPGSDPPNGCQHRVIVRLPAKCEAKGPCNTSMSERPCSAGGSP